MPYLSVQSLNDMLRINCFYYYPHALVAVLLPSTLRLRGSYSRPLARIVLEKPCRAHMGMAEKEDEAPSSSGDAACLHEQQGEMM